MRLAFDDTQATVEVPDCPVFLAALKAAAPHWAFRPCAASTSPAAHVDKAGGLYLIRTPGEDDIEASAVAAACAVICDLATAHADERPRQLSLHCAAVVAAGRLVVMPSRSHAGKSTLTARLAANGHTVFGDDMLLVDPTDRNGIAAGVAPRLRLPLPPRAGPVLENFVAAHGSARDDRYAYLDLPGSLLARRGAMAPLGAVMLLDRVEGSKAALYRAPRNAVLQSLIVQNVTLEAEAGDLLDRAAALVDRLACFTLVYDELDAAADLFEDVFGRWPLELARDLPVRAWRLTSETASGEIDDPPAPPTRVFARDVALARHPDVTLRRADGDLFLAGAQSVLHLNETGAGLWNLLDEPCSEAEASDILAELFPDIPRVRIDRDVAVIFHALAAAGMVTRHG